MKESVINVMMKIKENQGCYNCEYFSANDESDR